MCIIIDVITSAKRLKKTFDANIILPFTSNIKASPVIIIEDA